MHAFMNAPPVGSQPETADFENKQVWAEFAGGEVQPGLCDCVWVFTGQSFVVAAVSRPLYFHLLPGERQKSMSSFEWHCQSWLTCLLTDASLLNQASVWKSSLFLGQSSMSHNEDNAWECEVCQTSSSSHDKDHSRKCEVRQTPGHHMASWE